MYPEVVVVSLVVFVELVVFVVFAEAVVQTAHLDEDVLQV
jgi:hypothetical protein